MAYARLFDNQIIEYPVYQNVIISRFPDTSFATPFSPPSEYVEILEVQPPAVDHTQILMEGAPILEDGVWQQTWNVTPAPEDVLVERTALQAGAVRGQRNALLSQSDWTQLADASVDATAWATYRQQLRDVPAQENFPWTVTWPTAPSGDSES